MSTVKVLVIEDNPMNMELASDLLRAQDCDVLQAATALEALGVLQEVRPDMILMDIQLPGINGLDLTKRLKEDPRTQEIPIVAMTAYAMKGDEEKIFQAGCVGYIPKPIDTRQFSSLVKDVLSRNLVQPAGGPSPNLTLRGER